MTLTLVLPESGLDETARPHLHVAEDSQDALEAAAMLETAEAEDEAEPDVSQFLAANPDAEFDMPTEPAADGGCAANSSDSDQPAAVMTPVEPATPPVVIVKLDAREKYLRDKSAMEERLAGLTIEEMKLKEQAKLCKKEREVLAEQLSNLIDDWERGPAQDAAEPEPATAGGDAGQISTDQPPAVESADPAGPLPADPPATADSTAASHDEQARYQRVLEAAKIAELALPAKLEEKLTEAGVESVWQLETLRGDISQGRKEWPKGVGKAKVTTIEDALMKWLSRNQATWDTGEAERDADVAQTSVDHATAGNEPPTTAEAETAEDHDPLEDL